MEGTARTRNYALDIARIVAALAVVMIHCSAKWVMEYPAFSSEFIVGNLFDSISRIGVPFFLMISGALFLDENKQVTLKTVFSKNIKSLAIITVIWSVVYSVVSYIIFPVLENQTINSEYVIEGIINGHIHIWYLYMIMGMYVITPFLKKFVCEENKEMVLFFVMISICFQFSMPIINMICNVGLDVSSLGAWMGKFELDFFGGYIAYFLVGWYIVHVGIKQKWVRCIVYLSGLMALLAMMVYTYFTGDYNNAYNDRGLLSFVYSVSAFLALNNINWKLNENNAEKVVNLSKLTFGVYLIHMLGLMVCTKLLPYDINIVLYIIVSFMSVVCGSFFISYVISKIPVLKKIIKA